MSTRQADTAKSESTRQVIDRLAHEVGFDLIAVADASGFDTDRDIALQRIADGLMDGLPWFTNTRVEHGTDPEHLLPGARSIISLGLNYYPGPEKAGGPGTGMVARYARGRDYHRLMKRRMRRLVIALSEHPVLQLTGESLSARWFVDDGPMLDRAVAARAGLGWFGKNGNILSPTYGSWLLLGQILTNLQLEPDQPLTKTCGNCTRCIPACPTDAIVAPYVVDNRRCISYLTIENRGAIPCEFRPAMGTWVFGCDICQEVCPVNRKARASSDPNFGRRDLTAPDLIELLGMTEAEFRQRFAGTPIMRAKQVGMQRNACVALGNLRDRSAVPALTRALKAADPLVKGHAAWALGRIGGDDAELALRSAFDVEPDATVRDEVRSALGEIVQD